MAQCRGMMSVLLPDSHHLSPVIGLLMLNNPVLTGNLLRCRVQSGFEWGLGPSCALAREIFSQRGAGAPVRATRNRSQAAAHLTPSMIGTIVGLGITHAPSVHAAAQLRRAGIATNRVHGEWTGVSMSRHLRLIELLSEACVDGGETAPAVPLLLRLAWERAQSKECLLAFILALDAQRPVLADEQLRHSLSARQEWMQLAFAPSELSDSSIADAVDCLAVEQSGALQPRGPGSTAHSMELVAARLSQASAYKPALSVRRHRFQGVSPPRADCVEVAVRELIELLLYSPDTRSFALERLPPNCSPSLRRFFQDASGDVGDSEGRASTFFHLCQQLQGCDYLSALVPATGGKHLAVRQEYELRPNMRSLATAAAQLLGLQAEDGAEVACLRGLVRAWNAHLDDRGLGLESAVEVSVCAGDLGQDVCSDGEGAQATEGDAREMEAADVRLRGGEVTLEIRLLDALMWDRHHRIAIIGSPS